MPIKRAIYSFGIWENSASDVVVFRLAAGDRKAESSADENAIELLEAFKPCDEIDLARWVGFPKIIFPLGAVAQLGERCIRNAEAERSIPFRSIFFRRRSLLPSFLVRGRQYQVVPMPLPVRSLPVLQNWDCQGCTDCCREYRVFVSAEERARILAQAWAEDPALQNTELFTRDGGWFSGQYRLAHRADGACVFLNEKGGCRIHAKFGSEAKPLACRIYPFVLAPMGDHWRVGLRFACPSVTNDKGRPIAEHQAELRVYAEALEEREGIAGRAIPVPMLQRAQSVPWTDLVQLMQTFRGIVLDERRPLEWRLRKCLAMIELCRESRFDKISGDRLKEFLSVIGDGINPDVPAHPEAVAPPGWIGRILFRQAMAIYARKDSGRNRGISRHGRLALL